MLVEKRNTWNSGWSFLVKPETVSSRPHPWILPDDFVFLVPKTMWNRQSRLPVRGPLSPRSWATNQYGVVGGRNFYQEWEITNVDGQKALAFDEPLQGDQQIVLRYVSNRWIRPATSPPTATMSAQLGPPVSEFRTDYDEPLFNRHLLEMGTEAAFRRSEGYDWQAAYQMYGSELDRLIGQDAEVPELTLGRAFDGAQSDVYVNVSAS